MELDDTLENSGPSENKVIYLDNLVRSRHDKLMLKEQGEGWQHIHIVATAKVVLRTWTMCSECAHKLEKSGCALEVKLIKEAYNISLSMTDSSTIWKERGKIIWRGMGR